MNCYRNCRKPTRVRDAILLAISAVLLVACGSDDRSQAAGDAAATAHNGDQAPIASDGGRDAATAQDMYDEFAQAEIGAVDASGVSGIVRFDQRGSVLEIGGEIAGLTPGRHGLHIHENGDCSGPGAEASGAHFSPDSHPHGSPESPDAGHHAGDLGNIVADENGVADFRLADGELRLGTGPIAVNGLSIVVHENADDLQTQPDGNAGAAVGCAVIDPVPRPDYVPTTE